MKIQVLLALTLALFAGSLWVYQNENKRGTDLVSGSDYIKGLDVNQVQKIVLNFPKDQKITLSKDSNRFVLENYKSYPASTEKVNDLIFKIANIQVKKKISSNPDEEDLKNLGLDKESRKYLVEFFDTSENKAVSFTVGKSYKNNGNYLQKEGSKDIYLSDNSIWIDSSYKDFIDSFLIDLKKEDIVKVTLKNEDNIELSKKEEGFILDSPQISDYKKEKVEEYIKSFESVNFEEYFQAKDQDVKDLKFETDIRIQLKNKLTYSLKLAENNKNYYAKINVLVEDLPEQVVINKDDDQEKLKDIENMMSAKENAQKINLEKGLWVYKLDKGTYESFVKSSKFFM